MTSADTLLKQLLDNIDTYIPIKQTNVGSSLNKQSLNSSMINTNEPKLISPKP